MATINQLTKKKRVDPVTKRKTGALFAGFNSIINKPNYLTPINLIRLFSIFTLLPIGYMIGGFKGAETAVEIKVVEKYVLGVNLECL